MTTRIFLECLLFTALNIIPYYALLLHPFVNKLRFSKKITGVILVAVFFVELGIFSCIPLGVPASLSYILHFVVGIIFCIVAIDDRFGKSFLTFCILLDICAIVDVLGKYFEGIFFPEYAKEYMRWTHSLCIIPIMAIFLSLDYLYSKNVFSPALNRPLNSDIWRFLWMIPMTFAIMWYTVLYTDGNNDIQASLTTSNVVSMSIIMAGAFIMDYIIAKLIIEQSRVQELEKQEFVATLQQRNYQSMAKRVEDARRACHDLRHHLQIATAYLNDNKIDELKEYLKEYQVELPNDNMSTFCQNYTANALLTYYAQRLQEREIDYEVALSLPEECGIKQQYLAVLFGNMLENAADAATEAKNTGKPAKVSVAGDFDGNALFVSFENTVKEQPRPDENGSFKSTKHSGYGIGIQSVKTMAEETGGFLSIDQVGETFKVTVMLLK